MRFFGKTNIDFLGKAPIAACVSILLLAIGVVSLVLNGGPRLGIDVAGGSQIVVRFAEPVEIEDLRQALGAAGLEDSTIQEFEPASNEILIRTPGVAEGEQIDTAVVSVRAALASLDAGGQGLDLNTAGQDEVLALLLETNPLDLDLDLALEDATRTYRDQVDRIFSVKARIGLLQDWAALDGNGIDPAVVDAVRQGSRLGGHAIVNSESVGPQVGQDLRRQTIQAIIWALLGLLAYISYRFEFRFGVAAVIALVHDVLIALGAFSVSGREFNLPVIAAFLTIVGYSLNDTVVVFDRIRENANVMRRVDLRQRINTSLNQTLSRTLLTSGTTLIVVLSLFVYGGPVINDFSFALLVGVLIGTYSSLFVASPIVYIWQKRDLERRK